MSEQEYKKLVMNAMRAHGWVMQAHEDMYEKFIPDLSFSAHNQDGWVEMKFVHKPPTTLGDIKHYTVGQQEWLIKRGQAGRGLCFLWVGTPGNGYIWHWEQLRRVRRMPWADAIGHAYMSGGVPFLSRGMDAVVRQGRRG